MMIGDEGNDAVARTARLFGRLPDSPTEELEVVVVESDTGARDLGAAAFPVDRLPGREEPLDLGLRVVARR